MIVLLWGRVGSRTRQELCWDLVLVLVVLGFVVFVLMM